MQRLLAPGSVAVIGAGRAPGGVGRTVLRNLLAGGFTGRAVRREPRLPGGPASELDGVPGLPLRRARSPSPSTSPSSPCPPTQVPDVVAECGEHGVQGLVVLSAGYAESGAEGRERQRELVRQARSYGMRRHRPERLRHHQHRPGRPAQRLPLARDRPARGRIGLFTQSGAIGIALLAGLHRRGAGPVRRFVSAGNRADVSGNDVLQYWYEDPDTDVVLLYLESIGNPRKFTRLARRTAAASRSSWSRAPGTAAARPPGHAVPATRHPRRHRLGAAPAGRA